MKITIKESDDAGVLLLKVIVTLAIMGATSWLINCGIIKLITMCFGLTFRWDIATGIWLLMIMIKGCMNRAK